MPDNVNTEEHDAGTDGDTEDVNDGQEEADTVKGKNSDNSHDNKKIAQNSVEESDRNWQEVRRKPKQPSFKVNINHNIKFHFLQPKKLIFLLFCIQQKTLDCGRNANENLLKFGLPENSIMSIMWIAQM